MILGMCKNVGVTPDYVLYNTTYENLILYGYATPVYEPDDDKKSKFDDTLDANNPELNKQFDSERVTNPFI